MRVESKKQNSGGTSLYRGFYKLDRKRLAPVLSSWAVAFKHWQILLATESARPYRERLMEEKVWQRVCLKRQRRQLQKHFRFSANLRSSGLSLSLVGFVSGPVTTLACAS